MTYSAVVAWAGFLAVVTAAAALWHGRTDAFLRKFFVPALLARLVCGLLVGLLYRHFFETGDTVLYHQDAAALGQLAQTDFAAYLRFLWMGDDSFAVWAQLTMVEPRALLFTKIVSAFCLIGDSNYWLVACWLSVLSFAGAWLLTEQLVRCFPEYRLAFVIAILFWPSVVFWSSGVLKEAVALPALFWLVCTAVSLGQGWRPGWPEALGAPVALGLVWGLKYYWIGPAAPFLVFIAIGTKKSARFLAWAAAAAVCTLAVIMALHPNFYPQRVLQVITDNYYHFHYLTGGNNTFHFKGLAPDVASFLRHTPTALFSGLFRPFPWEGAHALHLLAAIENSALLALTVFMFFKFDLPARLRPWLVPLLLYALLECVLLTLSTPSWGTLVRYRIGMLPFFVMFVLAANRVFIKWQGKLV
jgi:hypothetical protein